MSHGLTKETIAAVFQKTALLEAAQFSDHQKEFQTKKAIASQLVEKLQGTPFYNEVKEKNHILTREFQQFEESLTHIDLSINNSEELASYFQSKADIIDELYETIRTLSDAREKIEKIFGMSEQSASIMNMFLPHKRVMQELQEELQRVSSVSLSPVVAPIARKKLLDPLKRVIIKAAAVLSSFSNYFNNENQRGYFSLNERGEVIVQDQPVEHLASKQAQARAAQVFFEALKQCYGVGFVQELKAVEEQEQPLNIQEAREVFQKIHESFQQLSFFLQKQPLLITEEYLDVLCKQPHLVHQMEHDYEALKPQERLLLQGTRENIVHSNTAITAMLLTSDLIPIKAVSTHLAIGAIHCPPLLVAMGVGALTGVVWAYMSGHQEATREAASVSTIYALEGTLAEMALESVISGSTWISCLGHFLGSKLLSGAMDQAIATTGTMDAIRYACAGGAISGGAASPNNERHQSVNVMQELNLDERLGVNYALEEMIKALDQLPIDAASVEFSRSKRIHL